MKKGLIIVMAAISLAGCQSNLTAEQKKSALKDSTNFTTIEWLDSTSKHIGTVEEGAQVPVSFRFKNTGKHNLIISDATASCGCTTPEKPEKPISPGEEGVIKAVFNSSNRVGSNDKTITVLANTTPQTSIPISFHVEVIPKK